MKAYIPLNKGTIIKPYYKAKYQNLRKFFLHEFTERNIAHSLNLFFNLEFLLLNT